MAYNGHCKQGYFMNGDPYGKFVEWDREGKQWSKEGIYLAGSCVKEEKIDSFEVNRLPHEANP